ncbi:MAG: hypothetical protein ACR2Q4_21790 [Geminicoccaceae bacterium]
MTKPTSMSAPKKTIGLSDRPFADFRHDQLVDTTEETTIQPLITAAILVTTAFRMRDQTALIQGLRRLVRAVRPFEVDTGQQIDPVKD